MVKGKILLRESGLRSVMIHIPSGALGGRTVLACLSTCRSGDIKG